MASLSLLENSLKRQCWYLVQEMQNILNAISTNKCISNGLFQTVHTRSQCIAYNFDPFSKVQPWKTVKDGHWCQVRCKCWGFKCSLVQTYIWAKKFACSPTQATQHLGPYTFLTGHTVNLLDVLSGTNFMQCFFKCRDGRIIFVRFCQTAKISVEKDLSVQKCEPMVHFKIIPDSLT